MSDHEEHPQVNYIKIYVILLVLFAISVIGPEIGKSLDMKIITLITAFGIAVIKAYLVCAHFMHLKYELRLISMMLFSCAGLLLLFFIGVAPDVMQSNGSNWTSTIPVETKESAAAKNKLYAEKVHGKGHGEDHGSHEGHNHSGHDAHDHSGHNH
jgi:caa(3)-type oxidase subunit IV